VTARRDLTGEEFDRALARLGFVRVSPGIVHHSEFPGVGYSLSPLSGEPHPHRDVLGRLRRWLRDDRERSRRRG
jgi:hypothetical protein